MPSTTNYGWSTPADSDLVKDGAAAIRTLGSSIDTTLKTQIDAQIPDSLLTTKGDLIAATGASTPARLGVGTDGQILTADAASASGVKWAAAPTAGLTSLATGTLSSTQVVISSISQSYKYLYLLVTSPQASTTGNTLVFRLNGTTSNNYAFTILPVDAAALTNDIAKTWLNPMPSENMLTTANNYTYWLRIENYALSKGKTITAGATVPDFRYTNYFMYGGFLGTTAITSITMLSSAGATLSVGTYTLYGAN